MNPVVIPWLAEIGIMTYRSLSGEYFSVTKGNGFSLQVKKTSGPKRPPLPSELLATFVIFGTYSVVGDSSNPQTRRIGALLAWGTVLATFLMLTSGGTTTNSPPSSTSSKG